MGNWFTEAFNAPGNLLQWMFPSLTPGLTTAQQEAALESRQVPAPETRAKMTDWSPPDIYEVAAQRAKTAAAIIGAGGPQDTSPPPVQCQWYEKYAPSDGSCHFGSTALFLVAGAGVVGLLMLRRR